MSGEWYYAEDDRQRGPVPLATLKEMARTGRITRSTLVWTEGMADWSEARGVADLFGGAPAGATQPRTGRITRVAPMYDRDSWQQGGRPSAMPALVIVAAVCDFLAAAYLAVNGLAYLSNAAEDVPAFAALDARVFVLDLPVVGTLFVVLGALVLCIGFGLLRGMHIARIGQFAASAALVLCGIWALVEAAKNPAAPAEQTVLLGLALLVGAVPFACVLPAGVVRWFQSRPQRRPGGVPPHSAARGRTRRGRR